MSTLTICIVVLFCIGYMCIALESLTRVNKAAIALLMCVGCWTLLMLGPSPYYPEIASGEVIHHIAEVIEHHLGDAAGTLFFLMGAMTIVEIVDSNGGFNFVRDTMKTRSKRKLLWRVAFMTFFLSAILDNLTTSIVMIMVLRKLVQSRGDRLIYAALVIISANSGGAFSPIGDVTTIMLWIKGVITTQGVISEIFIPSLVSMLIPAFILSLQLEGKFDKEQNLPKADVTQFTKVQRDIIFWLGVGGLIFVPIFKTLTHLPPFMGILLVLGILWTTTETTTEIFHYNTAEDDTMAKRVSDIMTKIDLSTIMFFLGILMAVAVLQEVGVLTMLGKGLDTTFEGNHYLVTGIIGVLSSWRLGCRWHLLAVAGLLCWCGWFYAHHRFCRWCCCHGLGEDYLRLVHEESHMDCLRGLPRWYLHLLAGKDLPLLIRKILTYKGMPILGTPFFSPNGTNRMAWKLKYRCKQCGYEAEVYEGRGLFRQEITAMSCPDCKTIQNIVVGGIIADVAPSYRSEVGRLCLQCGSDNIRLWDKRTCPKCQGEMEQTGDQEFWT